ncbi:MAG: hypothetical protein ACE5PT_05430 [Gemmatimonadales bacterium]
MRAAIRIRLIFGIAALAAVGSPRAASAQAETPSFVQVGRTYWISVLDDERVIEVLEIGDGGWIRVRLVEENEEFWLNTRHVVLMREFTPEMQARAAARAYEAAMKADLQNLLVAQEIYFAEHATYTAKLAELDFTPSAGVQISIGAASDTGWHATARHARTQLVCRVGVGSETPRGLTEGLPACGLG